MCSEKSYRTCIHTHAHTHMHVHIVTYIESIEFHVKKKEHQKRRRTRTNESVTRFYLVFVRTDTVWRDNQYLRWYNRDVVRSYGKEHKDYTILAIGSTGASYFVYPTVRLEIG